MGGGGQGVGQNLEAARRVFPGGLASWVSAAAGSRAVRTDARRTQGSLTGGGVEEWKGETGDRGGRGPESGERGAGQGPGWPEGSAPEGGDGFQRTCLGRGRGGLCCWPEKR